MCSTMSSTMSSTMCGTMLVHSAQNRRPVCVIHTVYHTLAERSHIRLHTLPFSPALVTMHWVHCGSIVESWKNSLCPLLCTPRSCAPLPVHSLTLVPTHTGTKTRTIGRIAYSNSQIWRCVHRSAHSVLFLCVCVFGLCLMESALSVRSSNESRIVTEHHLRPFSNISPTTNGKTSKS